VNESQAKKIEKPIKIIKATTKKIIISLRGNFIAI